MTAFALVFVVLAVAVFVLAAVAGSLPEPAPTRAVDFINAKLREPIRWPRWEVLYVPTSTMRAS